VSGGSIIGLAIAVGIIAFVVWCVYVWGKAQERWEEEYQELLRREPPRTGPWAAPETPREERR
jgi:uncharacterized membrane protein (DUF485 family)